jgi:hypothetical protein
MATPPKKPIAGKKNEFDPNRFTGKTFSHRMTLPDSTEDYSIRIDGLTAGRIMKKDEGTEKNPFTFYQVKAQAKGS